MGTELVSRGGIARTPVVLGVDGWKYQFNAENTQQYYPRAELGMYSLDAISTGNPFWGAIYLKLE